MKTEVRSDPFIFRTVVPHAGYEWRKGFDSKPYLGSRATIGGLASIKEPLRNDGLFLEFANLKPTQEAIQNFANTWGEVFHRLDLLPQKKDRLPVQMGASLESWKDAIGDMRVLVHLWESIKGRNRAELKKIITWSNGGVRYSIRFPSGGFYNSWIAHPSDADSKLLARFTPGDLIWPAKYALQAEINRRIADPELMIKPQLAWTSDMDQRIIFTPKSLLAGMWLQFGQAVTEEFQLKRCEGCQKYFQSGPGGRRADATTCSDACRQRKRRKK